MSDLTFYDAAVPPPNPPQTDGVAFYIGGDAAHVWTLAEIEATTARYRLPIFVRSQPGGVSEAMQDAKACVTALKLIGAPKGCLVSWDTETAADPEYMRTVFAYFVAAGYKLMDYGSQSAVFGNELAPGAYYWGADWTGNKAILQGDAGTQYIEDVTVDLDVFKAGLPFWDTHAHGTTPTPPVTWQEHMMQQLPTVKQGATGTVVRTIQGLCGSRGWPVAIDGSFGPDTENAVHLVQVHAGVISDGIVGPQTWPALLGI